MVIFMQSQDGKYDQIKPFLPKDHSLKQQDDELKFVYFHTNEDIN